MHSWITLPELSRQLGRDRREVEKLASRGRIPGQKRQGEWRFHESEVVSWLETELRDFSDDELAGVEAGQDSESVDAGRPLTSILRPELCEAHLPAKTRRSVMEALVEVAGRTYQVWEPAAVLAAVKERDDLCPTAHAGGVAVPHPRSPMPDVLGESVAAFGRVVGGVPFGAPDGGLTDLFFLIACRDARTHLHVLARLGRMLQLDGFREDLRGCESGDEAFAVIEAAEAAV